MTSINLIRKKVMCNTFKMEINQLVSPKDDALQKDGLSETQFIGEYKKIHNERKKRRNKDWIDRELYMYLISNGISTKRAKNLIIKREGICSWWYYS